MAKISVIAALFNHERYVSEAIESVLCQTYSNWELILWDDGSTDRSLEIARFYAKKDQRIFVFQHENGTNLGQEATRNAAITKSTGEYLSLLDTDDYFLPGKFELLLPFLKKENVGFAYGRAKFLDQQTGKFSDPNIEAEPEGDVVNALLWDNFICAGAVLFKREALESNLRFDTSLKTCGEYPLWVEIALKWKFAKTAEEVAVWRNHGENTGSIYAIEAKEELVNLKERWMNDSRFSDSIYSLKKSYAKNLYDLAALLYQNLDLSRCRNVCNRIGKVEGADQSYLLKAKVLKTLSYSGKLPNYIFSLIKQKLWEIRR